MELGGYIHIYSCLYWWIFKLLTIFLANTQMLYISSCKCARISSRLETKKYNWWGSLLYIIMGLWLTSLYWTVSCLMIAVDSYTQDLVQSLGQYLQDWEMNEKCRQKLVACQNSHWISHNCMQLWGDLGCGETDTGPDSRCVSRKYFQWAQILISSHTKNGSDG